MCNNNPIFSLLNGDMVVLLSIGYFCGYCQGMRILEVLVDACTKKGLLNDKVCTVMESELRSLLSNITLLFSMDLFFRSDGRNPDA